MHRGRSAEACSWQDHLGPLACLAASQLAFQPLSPFFPTRDTRGMGRIRRSSPPASPQVAEGGPDRSRDRLTRRPAVCRLPRYRMILAEPDTSATAKGWQLRGGRDDQEAAVQEAVLLTDLLARRPGTGGRTGGQETSTGPMPWSARRTGTRETRKTRVVWSLACQAVPGQAWNGSWNPWPRNSSAISASGLLT